MRQWNLPLRHLAGLPRLAISREDFDGLREYSVSLPTGVYYGKLWRCQLENGRWVVRGYIATDRPNEAEIATWKPRFVLKSSAFVEVSRRLYERELTGMFGGRVQ